jgi:ATP-binding cassette subfamily C (CFTR/MRP) protein 1
MANQSVSFFGSTQISKTIGCRQKVWIDAVQKRITITASMLSEIRSIKTMGLSRLVASLIQDQRVKETRHMAGFRWSLVWQNVVQNLPWALAPALTFSIYAIQALVRGISSIETTQAFTSLSIITLLTNPAAKLLSAIPSTAASLGCFDRIQKFLLTVPRVDRRISVPSGGFFSTIERQVPEFGDVEMVNLIRKRLEDKMISPVAVVADRVALRPAPSAEVVLKNVSFTIPRGSLTMVIGLVGSGKTTLLKAILGETSYGNDGSISVASRRMAVSTQTPWLPNTTIRQAIVGSIEVNLGFDEDWYIKSLHACALDHDISRLPEGDQTQIGSAKTVLSGGQKHRISLARAVYSRAEIILLDDVFSALDTNTQTVVMFRLFGEAGLLRRPNMTVVLATHASQFHPTLLCCW